MINSNTHLKEIEAIPDRDVDTSDIPELDEDVLDWFKAQGKGHLTRMNAVLRAYMMAHSEK